MRVLIACEFSGVVRREFVQRGHKVHSCDLLPCADDSLNGPTFGGHHWIRDAVEMAYEGGPWDLMIAHPPCTYLAVSGARWFKGRKREQKLALEFVRNLLNAPIHRIALENPVSIISSHIRKPDQIIQPWQFGHGEVKRTCLWLKNLKPLTPTRIVAGRSPRVWLMPPSPNRGQLRSITFRGIARAMAAQWGTK